MIQTAEFCRDIFLLGHIENNITCVKAKLSMKEGEEVLDVCQAIQMIAENAKAEGVKEGIKEGQVSALLQSVKNLAQNMEMTTEQAMNVLGVSDSDRKILSTLF